MSPIHTVSGLVLLRSGHFIFDLFDLAPKQQVSEKIGSFGSRHLSRLGGGCRGRGGEVTNLFDDAHFGKETFFSFFSSRRQGGLVLLVPRAEGNIANFLAQKTY